MAESIVVCFKTAQWPDVQSTLAGIAATGTHPGNWVYPAIGDHDVTAYEYDDILKEFEVAHVAQLTEALGHRPSSILCIEMRGSRGKTAVDSAGSLAQALLRRFEAVVDDLWAEPGPHIWTLDEIQNGVEKDSKPFLGCYRDRLRA